MVTNNNVSCSCCPNAEPRSSKLLLLLLLLTTSRTNRADIL